MNGIFFAYQTGKSGSKVVFLLPQIIGFQDDTNYVAIGGVTPENIPEFRKAGCLGKTHLLKVIDETTVLAKKAEIVMVEVIVRNIAAGSFSKKYGVPEGSPLKNTVVEFSYKSDELGDPMINDSQITAIGLATQEELDELRAMSKRINELMTELFAKGGVRLVDFKLEFGRTDEGLVLCDEISPDSCRLWDMETNKKLDKDRFRRDLGDVLGGYRDVLERLKSSI